MPSIALPVSLRGQLLSGTRTIAFSPVSLFSANEPGVWFDPSDLTTLFQDPAGTTPVTAPGQTVGLMLDKSRGLALGAELVANGGFNNSSAWTLGSGWAIANGVATHDTTSGYLRMSQINLLTVGKLYLIEFQVVSRTSGQVFVGGSGSGYVVASAAGLYSALVAATETVLYVTSENFVGSIDNISVRELAGNHATQATLAARPTYSIEPVVGRRNLLTYSELLSNAAWVKTTSPAVTLTDQGSGVWRLQASAGSWLLYQSRASSGTHNFSIEVKSNGSGLDGFSLMLGSSAGGADRTATGDWVRYSASGLSGDIGIIRNSALAAVDVLIRFPQFELGSTATPYQRVTTQHDVTEAGVASVSYLYFDGVNDSMATSTITPGTDKVQVFAGARKLSNTTTRVLVGLSTVSTNNGSFELFAPVTTAGEYQFNSKGTVFDFVRSVAISVPITNVLTALGDISADRATLRIDGTQVAQATADQGTGNYLAYPIYIGARGGASLEFSGHLYSLITRFGPTLDAPTITSTEIWVGDKTGIDIAKIISTTIYTRSGDTILDRANSTIERRAV